MSRFTLLVVLLSFANGCSALPGTVRSQAVVNPSLKTITAKDQKIPGENSATSSPDVDVKPGESSLAESLWSPEELMVGSAVKAHVEAHRQTMSQRWEPAFASNHATIKSDKAEICPVPAPTITSPSVRTRLTPMPETETGKETEGPPHPLHAEGTPHDQPKNSISACNDVVLVAPHALRPLRVAAQLANPMIQSAYVATVAKAAPEVTEGQTTRIESDPADCLAAVESTQNPLDQLLSQLQSANRLRLNRVCLCRQVDGFGQVVEFPDAMFDPGEDILIYCEVDNFKSLPESNQAGTCHRTSLSGNYLILNAEGDVVAEHEYAAVDDVSSAQRDDFFLVFPARIPTLAPGRYRMYLVVHDELGHDLVAHGEPIQFQIALTGQAHR